jgi:hypothetical protein
LFPINGHGRTAWHVGFVPKLTHAPQQMFLLDQLVGGEAHFRSISGIAAGLAVRALALGSYHRVWHHLLFHVEI